jgi:methyltransferase (TIGR00027 family)
VKEGRGSRTAERVAASRAAHQLLDKPPLFDDPLALKIAEPDLERESNLIAPFLRAGFAARSRFAEDELHLAVARGVRQYVVLGAGFDTFAYRNPHEHLRVFEVDHPATQEVKRKRLAGASITIPANTIFVAIDFATTSLRDALAASGLDTSAPAFFSWLGVIPYLELPAIESTLGFVGSLSRGTAIVFDYGSSPSALSFAGRIAFKLLSDRVAAAGEPWKTFFDPHDLEALLRRCGFTNIEDLGQNAINARYFAGRTDGLRTGEMMHIVKATV